MIGPFLFMVYVGIYKHIVRETQLYTNHTKSVPKQINAPVTYNATTLIYVC